MLQNFSMLTDKVVGDVAGRAAHVGGGPVLVVVPQVAVHQKLQKLVEPAQHFLGLGWI